MGEDYLFFGRRCQIIIRPTIRGSCKSAVMAARYYFHLVDSHDVIRDDFGALAIDLADVPPVRLRQIPFTTWPRVQRVIEGSDTACVLLTPEPLARSAGGLTLSLAGRSTWAGVSDRSRLLQGVDLRVRVVSPRKRIDGDVRVRTVAP